MCLAGYEPLLDGCAVCGAEPPEHPCFHLREGILHCAKCQKETAEGTSLPLNAQTLDAMRHIVYGNPKRLFSFPAEGDGLRQLADLAEAYLQAQLERGFRTLDFYKEMQTGLHAF
jgi:DNA repair protein RecO (recombination protein O)